MCEAMTRKETITLTITSLLSILFTIFHITDEISRGMEHARLNMVAPLMVVALWGYATLLLVERRSGLIIIVLMSIIGIGIPIAHMIGAGLIGRRIANTGGIFFWVLTLFLLELNAAVVFVLSVQRLWRLRSRPAQ
jgi:hypothetical protein